MCYKHTIKVTCSFFALFHFYPCEWPWNKGKLLTCVSSIRKKNKIKESHMVLWLIPSATKIYCFVSLEPFEFAKLALLPLKTTSTGPVFSTYTYFSFVLYFFSLEHKKVKFFALSLFGLLKEIFLSISSIWCWQEILLRWLFLNLHA